MITLHTGFFLSVGKSEQVFFCFWSRKYVACTYFGDNTYKCVCFSFSQAKNGGLAVNAQGRWYDEDGEWLAWRSSWSVLSSFVIKRISLCRFAAQVRTGLFAHAKMVTRDLSWSKWTPITRVIAVCSNFPRSLAILMAGTQRIPRNFSMWALMDFTKLQARHNFSFPLPHINTCCFFHVFSYVFMFHVVQSGATLNP